MEIGDCAEENVLICSGEMVLMQTAKAEIQGHNNPERAHVRILLNSGSQRTYTKTKFYSVTLHFYASSVSET